MDDSNEPTFRADRTPEAFNERGNSALPGHLGFRITRVDPDRIEGVFDVRPFHMAPNGFLHGGTVVAFADTLCGYATVVNLPEGASGFTTIELKTNYFSTARDGSVFGRAEPVHLGRTTHVWDCDISHAGTGRRMALFRCTNMILLPKV